MSFIDPALIKPFNVVLDAGSGMAGLVAPRLFDRLPCKTTRLCFEVDGTFPNHEANPLIEENRTRHHRAGAAREGRHRHRLGRRRRSLFFIDGNGEFIAGDFITALLAEAFLIGSRARPSSTTCAPATPSRTPSRKYGGTARMNRVGHAFIKRRMRETNAVFGGEVTGHYYFRDYYYRDNGFIPALLILELMSRKNQTLAQLLEPLRAEGTSSPARSTRASPTCRCARRRSTSSPRSTQDGQRLHDGRRVGRSTRPGTSTCARRTRSR